MRIDRRALLSGAAALAAMPSASHALTPAQQLLLMGQGGGTLPSVTGFNNFTGKNLTQYFAGLAARAAGTRNAVTMDYGDSTVAGYGSNGNGFVGAEAKSWAAVLASLTANSGRSSRIADGNALASGNTVTQYDPRVTFSGGYAGVLATTVPILGGSLYQSSTAGALYNFNPGVVVDTFIVGLAAKSDTGQVQASIDGGATPLATFGLSASPTFVPIYTTVSVPRGSQTLTLKAVAGAPNNIMSVVAYDSTAKEISIWNAGYGGATSAILSATGSFPAIAPITLLTGAGNFRPDLVIGENGIVNDWNGVGGLTLSQSLANNQAIINAVKGYGGSIILMTAPPSNPAQGFASYVTQGSFVAQMKALAYSNNVPLIDVWTLFGGTFQAALMALDGEHYNQAGGVQIAGYANTAMAPGFRAK